MSPARPSGGARRRPPAGVPRTGLSPGAPAAVVTEVRPTEPSDLTVNRDDDALPATGLDGVDVLALPAGRSGVLGRRGRAVQERWGIDLGAVVADEKFGGAAGEVLRVPAASPDGLPRRLLLVGVGGSTPAELRRAGASLARAVRGRGRLATTVAADAPADGVRGFLEGLLLGGYVPPRAGTLERRDVPVGSVDLWGPYPARAVETAAVHARATWRARDLAATPSTVKTPAWVAEQAVSLAAGAGLSVTVWDEERLRSEGFGGLLAVASGAAAAARFVQVEYPGRGPADARPVVLVGKGVTFDTGGLSIKPREAMVPMKTDMTGAAVVLAALAACRDAGVRRRVVGLLPLAENGFGAASYRPGDVVQHVGGLTSEVVNTDAEGRMLLADALAYADRRLDPTVLVDVATLTGAATLGLGRRHAALYATDDALAAAFERAAAASGERVWRMPLVEDYRAGLDSDIADLRHVADGPVGGGSIVAALFLREFTGGRRWVHLDIAGPARAERDENEVTKGATGFGARLLLRWLEGLR